MQKKNKGPSIHHLVNAWYTSCNLPLVYYIIIKRETINSVLSTMQFIHLWSRCQRAEGAEGIVGLLGEILYFFWQLLWTLKSMPLGTKLILWPLLKTQSMPRHNKKKKIIMEEVIALGTVMDSLEIPCTCKHLTGLSMTFVSVFTDTWRLSSVQHFIIAVRLCWLLSWRKVSLSFSKLIYVFFLLNLIDYYRVSCQSLHLFSFFFFFYRFGIGKF